MLNHLVFYEDHSLYILNLFISTACMVVTSMLNTNYDSLQRQIHLIHLVYLVFHLFTDATHSLFINFMLM